MARSRSSEGEAARILSRVAREANSDAMPAVPPAESVPEEDWAEIWGTRIGRVLGPLLLLIAGAWFVARLMHGG